MIHLEKVSKHYRKDGNLIRALDDVSMDVPQGSLALVRGASGSGKSTLVDLIGGLTHASSGAIRVADQDVHRMNAGELSALRAREVSLVFQLFHLVPYLSALDNVLLPTLAAPVEAPRERALGLLDELGLADRARHFPSEMSAGERQRCAMARALLNRPKIILADEPTGNLDEESAAKVLEKLDACRQEGATVLLVSHQHFHHIQADVEFQLEQGKLVS